MIEIQLISFLICFCVVCGLSYWALQRLNFKNLFAPDSTTQIRVIILIISVALGLICAIGIAHFVEVIYEVIAK